MIKKKYKNKMPKPLESLRQSLIEMKKMRSGELPKENIHVFLDKISKDIEKSKNGYLL